MILEAIDKLNVSKAPGPDGIHARIIKECKVTFSTVFRVIFTKSLTHSPLSTFRIINTRFLGQSTKKYIFSNENNY